MTVARLARRASSRSRNAGEAGARDARVRLRGAIVDIAAIAIFDGQIGQGGLCGVQGVIVGMTPVAGDPAMHRLRRNTPRSLIDTPAWDGGEWADRGR